MVLNRKMVIVLIFFLSLVWSPNQTVKTAMAIDVSDETVLDWDNDSMFVYDSLGDSPNDMTDFTLVAFDFDNTWLYVRWDIDNDSFKNQVLYDMGINVTATGNTWDVYVSAQVDLNGTIPELTNISIRNANDEHLWNASDDGNMKEDGTLYLDPAPGAALGNHSTEARFPLACLGIPSDVIFCQFRSHASPSVNSQVKDYAPDSGYVVFTMYDNPPELYNLTKIQYPQEAGDYVNITVDIVDDYGVEEVLVNIMYPNGSWINESMKKANGTKWFHNNIYMDSGEYSYIILTKDTRGNLNQSAVHQFTISTIDYIQIRTGYNGAGEVANAIIYNMNETNTYYASGYNNTHGYLGEVKVNWVSNNEDAGRISPSYGMSMTFTAVGPGSGIIYAIHGFVQNSTIFEVLPSQSPQIKGTIPNIFLQEDFGLHQIDLTQYASDPQDPISALKWQLTGVDTSIITTVGEDFTGNHIISFISKKNMYGNIKVMYWLVDSNDNKASQEAWINISLVNDHPSILNCPNLFVHFDTPYTFDYTQYIRDIDNPLSELTLTCDDTIHTTVNGLSITYNYPESMMDEKVYVVLTVSDGEANGSKIIKVTITSEYPPVTVAKIPDVTIHENETMLAVFDLDDYIMDPDGDSLYMSYGNTHVDITIYDNHMVDISALGEWNGAERVTFRAEDPIGAIVEQTINVTVIPVNDPPSIKPLPSMMVHYEHPYDFNMEWYLSDNDNDIEELIISTSNPDNVSVEGTYLRFLYPKYWDGQSYPYNISLIIYVSDGIDNASQTITVTVDDNYPPEVFQSLGDLFFHEDETIIGAYDLDDHYRDVDSQTIFFSSGNLNINVSINENNTVDFSVTPNWFGSELITIRATDNEGAFAEYTIHVIVLPINDPPSIITIPPQIGEKDQAWLLDLTEYIFDIDTDLEELRVSVNSSYVRVVGHILIFEYPSDITDDTIWVTVSDGELAMTVPVDIRIISPQTPQKNEPWLWFLLPIILIVLLVAILMIRSRLYTVEDLFLITNSGILIAHAGRTMDNDQNNEKDEDILAAMFVAVQEFIKDAFAKEEGHTLKRMDYGDKKVLIYMGDQIRLSAFISGQVTKSFYQKMEDFVKDVEERYKEGVRHPIVAYSDFPDVETMMLSLLEGSYNKGYWKKDDKEDERENT